MRRNPGHAGPNSQAHAIRRALVPDPFLADAYQFGYVAAVHGSYTSTLSAQADAGATSVSLAAEPSVNDMLLLAGNPPLRVSAVSGAGPYVATVYPTVQVQVASGASVTTLKTVDLHLDQSQEIAQVSQLVWGVRYLEGYSPAVYDYVAIARTRPSAGAGSDRFVLGRFA